jgi:phage/plasmid-like protein (TIGR03299 family)
MSAEFKQGFSVREAMWHGLGTILPDYVDRAEGMKLAGHDRTIHTVPLYLKSDMPGIFPIVSDFVATVGSDRPDHALGVVGETYGIVQESSLWDLADAFYGEGGFRAETGGLLRDGRLAWLLLKNGNADVPGDPSSVSDYVFLATSHDSSYPLSARRTRVRVVCKNTWDAAMFGKQAIFSLKHTSRVNDRIEAVRSILERDRAEQQEEADILGQLVTQRIEPGEINAFLAEWFDLEKAFQTSQDGSTRALTMAETAIGEVRTLLASPTCQGISDTRYGLLQAGIEYLDYVKGTRNDESGEQRMLRAFVRSSDEKRKLLRKVQAL